MKLELKHLAPYLPYKMKFVIDMYEFTEGNCKPEIRHFTMGNDLSMCLNYGKPILRPLSDLTKEIEHNGEKFVPLDELTEGDTVSMSLNDYADDWDNRTYYSFRRYVEEWVKGDIYHLDFLPYGFINKLHEWHFDVFGLIEKGLAIDINTIEPQP